MKAELIAEYYTGPRPCCPCKPRPKMRGQVFYGDEDTQAFAYTHLILTPDWLLSRNWGPAGAGMLSLIDPKQTGVDIKAGGTAQLKLFQSRFPHNEPSLKFELRNAPKGLSIAKTEVQELTKGNRRITLTFKAEKDIKPVRVNLPVTAVYSFKTKPDKNGKIFQRKSEFILPILLFNITGD